jgi:hypothetical protein
MTEKTEVEALRNWTEDFAHENGQYLHFCSRCGWEFVGHKRRIVCKVCAEAPTTPPPAGDTGEAVAVIEAIAAWLEKQRRDVPGHGWEFAAAIRARAYTGGTTDE